MENNLQNKNIQDTYPRLVQIVDGLLYNGNGELLNINTGEQDTIYPMVHSANMMMRQQTEFIKSINNNWK